MGNERVVSELGLITRTVLTSARLANVFSDPDTPEEVKSTIISELGGGAFDSATVDFVAGVANEKSRSGPAFASALVEAVANYIFTSAERDGNIEPIERELYELASLIRGNDNLRDALANPLVTDAVKDQLLAELLKNKVVPEVVELARILIALDHGRDVDEGAEQFSYQVAALRNLTVAEVHTAVELDDEHRRRLTEALSNSVGKPVEPRFSVDPSILGSVIIRIGDEVLDGSVRHRLNQARQALLGAQ
jgi:F-type H+-transporting ATPase subunit delta